MFIGLLSACSTALFGESLAFTSKRHVKCVFLNNWLYQARPAIVNINSN